jgi:tRNA(fMet)-specific endonuclease VapC
MLAIVLSDRADLLPVLPLPKESAEAYGKIRAELEARGELIGKNNLWIAAHALASGLTLVTNNEKEFRRVRGLKVQNLGGVSCPGHDLTMLGRYSSRVRR